MNKFFEIKNRALNSQLVTDSFWSLFGNVIFRGLSLIAGIIIARFLGKDIFGEYGIIKNTIISIAMFSTFGLSYTATKYVAELKNKDQSKLKATIYYATLITLVISGLMALLVFIFANYIAQSVLGVLYLNVPLRIVAILIVFNALTSTQIGVLSGFGKFKEMAKVNFVVGIATFIFSLILTYLYALNGALLALLITQLLNWYLNFRLVNENKLKGIFNFKKDKQLLKEIIHFSTPVALQEGLFSVTYWLSSLLIIKYASFGELGLYTASMQWNAIILFIPGILRNVILSHLSGAEAENRHERILKVTLGINFLMTFIPAVLIFIFSDFIAEFYGVSFVGLNKLISIAVFITIFSSISNVYTQAYMSKGMNWMMFAFRFIRDVGTILVFLVLLRYNLSGAIAMIYSSLLISFVFMILMALYYQNNLKILKQ